MSLYWSGALEEKTSALSVSMDFRLLLDYLSREFGKGLRYICTNLNYYVDSQGNLMVEDEDQLLFFTNGMTVDLSSYGVISFDSSGQVMINST